MPGCLHRSSASTGPPIFSNSSRQRRGSFCLAPSALRGRYRSQIGTASRTPPWPCGTDTCLKTLTTTPQHDLDKLPDQFKALDEAFRLGAEKLAPAAKTKDAEAVSFQSSRLLDTCVACHSTYAKSKFPNFRSEGGAEHCH
ncbi:MAG TPA: hypothetical protein DEA71_15560 [Nitrospira sp.]|nr:hypothetical protein [Nitrospira sp.]